MRSIAHKRIAALEKVAAARIAEADERTRAAERFARKLEKMTPEDRAEVESILDAFEKIANRFGLREPLTREGKMTVLRQAPDGISHRYSEILGRYKD